MGKKRKLTPAEKEAKKARQKKYMTVFMNGKQKRVKRPPMVDGIPLDEFIRRNADPIWLHQNEMWEYMPIEEPLEGGPKGSSEWDVYMQDGDEDIPF